MGIMLTDDELAEWSELLNHTRARHERVKARRAQVRDREPGAGEWRTKDGRVLSLAAMDLQHLLNVRRLLRSVIRRGRGTFGCSDRWGDPVPARRKLVEVNRELRKRGEL